MELVSTFNELRSSPDKLLAQITRYGPPVVSVLLVAVIAWQLAGLTWTLVPRPSPEPPPVVDLTPETADTDTGGVDVSGVVDAHLFGVYNPESEIIEPVDDEPTEVYQGPLKLIGTLAAEERERSLAVIEDAGEATVYAVGDTVRNGITLSSVAAKHVVITERGQSKRLELPKADATGTAAPRARSRTATRQTRASSRQSASRTGALADVGVGSAKLGDFIRPQPVFANGKQRGYRVYPGRKREQFTSLGLKPGDLVTEINGSPLDDPARGLEVFRSIASASQVSVTIERNGQPTSLVLDTSQINLGADPDR